MKSIALALLVSALTVLADPAARTIKLAWDYQINPGDSITNYVFNLRGSQVANAPLPWPIMSQSFGTTQAQVTIFLPPTTSQFFYVTVSNLTSTGTNWWAESDPSNTARYQVTPSGFLKIVP